MNYKNFSTTLAVAALWIAAVPSAFAQVTVYFGEDANTNATPGANNVPRGPRTNADAAYSSFTSDAGPVGVESFESFSPGALGNNAGLSFSPLGITGTATHTGNLTVQQLTNPTGTTNGTYPTDGVRYLTSSNLGNANLSIAFSQAVGSFGLYFTDIEVIRPTVTFDFTDGTSQTFTVNASLPGNGSSGNVAFWGGVSTLGITNVSFTGGADGIGLDNFAVSSTRSIVSVPGPSALVAFGVAAASRLRRRRR